MPDVNRPEADLPLANVKPGDALLISDRFGQQIGVVDRITPSGRVIIKKYTFNPDGWLRGNNVWNPRSARPATAEDMARLARRDKITKVRDFRSWEKLTHDELATISEIIGRY